MALDLLPDLLEAVHDGDARDRVDSMEGVEAHARQVVLARYLSEVDYSLLTKTKPNQKL